MQRLRSRVVGRGRGAGASLFSKQVFHQDAIVCHLCQEPGVTVASSSLLKFSPMAPNIILFFLPVFLQYCCSHLFELCECQACTGVCPDLALRVPTFPFTWRRSLRARAVGTRVGRTSVNKAVLSTNSIISPPPLLPCCLAHRVQQDGRKLFQYLICSTSLSALTGVSVLTSRH